MPLSNKVSEVEVVCNATLGEGWFYEGGGLYRPVHLVQTTDGLRLAHQGVSVRTKIAEDFATPPPLQRTAALPRAAGIECAPETDRGGGGKCRAGSAEVSVSVEVANGRDAAASFRVLAKLYHGADGGGEVVATASTGEHAVIAGHGSTTTVFLAMTVANVSLWSMDFPQLYRLETALVAAGSDARAHSSRLDEDITVVGVRKIRWLVDSGLRLNNRAVKLRGVANHQDLGGVGTAVPDALQAYRVHTMKAVGANFWRCAHNPPNRALMAAADRLGMAVMVENRRFGPGDNYDRHNAAAPVTPEQIAEDITAMARAHRNSPSVFMWSLCNEEGCYESRNTSATGGSVGARMKQILQTLDGSRAVMAAMSDGMGYISREWSPTGNGPRAYNYGPGASYALASVVDLLGVNYQYGDLDSWHDRRALQPLLNSESAACTCARGTYADVFTNTTVHQSTWNCIAGAGCLGDVTMEASWATMASRPFMAGGVVWSGFDYRGEPSLIQSDAGMWPAVSSSWGIHDLVGFRKDMAWAYQAWWTDTPVVHLVPHTWARPADPGNVTVWVYSNADQVELFLNDKSLGVRSVPSNSHAEWTALRWEPGRLVAVARALASEDETRGTVLADNTLVTPSAPTKLRLSLDWPLARTTALVANGRDVAMLRVEIVDDAGVLAPTASNRVSFEVAGPGHVLGVGNGDPSSHEPDKASGRLAFNGLVRCIVGTDYRRNLTAADAVLRVEATADGLAPASMVLSVSAPP